MTAAGRQQDASSKEASRSQCWRRHRHQVVARLVAIPTMAVMNAPWFISCMGHHCIYWQVKQSS
jgi:hypothetical protein